MFIQLNPFASPNYISTSQTEKLAMFLGHCSPQATPGHCLPGHCFPCIEIFPQNMRSHRTDHCMPVQTSVPSMFTHMDRANDFWRSPTTLFSLTFRRALGRPKVFVHLIALNSKRRSYYPQHKMSPKRKKTPYQFLLTWADNTGEVWISCQTFFTHF